MTDRRTEGLYGKFEVRRTDGTDAPGGKHDGCTYFVLDLQHDKHMPAALRAYATSCEKEYPVLASQLRIVANDFGSRAEFAGIMAQKPALDLERQRLRAGAEALAPSEPTRFDLLEDPTRGLHAVLTRYGIASRTGYESLVTALVRWAADAYRSSAVAPLTDAEVDAFLESIDTSLDTERTDRIRELFNARLRAGADDRAPARSTEELDLPVRDHTGSAEAVQGRTGDRLHADSPPSVIPQWWTSCRNGDHQTGIADLSPTAWGFSCATCERSERVSVRAAALDAAPSTEKEYADGAVQQMRNREALGAPVSEVRALGQQARQLAASIERVNANTLKALFAFLGPQIKTRIDAEAEITRLRAGAAGTVPPSAPATENAKDVDPRGVGVPSDRPLGSTASSNEPK